MEKVPRAVQKSPHPPPSGLRLRLRLHEAVRRRRKHHGGHNHRRDRRLRPRVPFREVNAGTHQTRTSLMPLVTKNLPHSVVCFNIKFV